MARGNLSLPKKQAPVYKVTILVRDRPIVFRTPNRESIYHALKVNLYPNHLPTDRQFRLAISSRVQFRGGYDPTTTPFATTEDWMIAPESAIIDRLESFGWITIEEENNNARS